MALRLRPYLLALSLTFSTFVHAQVAGTWEAWAQQNDRRLPLSGVVTLKRAPFQIVFRAPSDHALALVGSEERAELEPLLRPDLGGAIRGTNIAAEVQVSARNTSLIVNARGVVAKDFTTAQLWYDDAAEPHASYQTIAKGEGYWTFTREITSLCVNTQNDEIKCSSVSASSVENVSLLLADVPAGAPMRFVAPRLVTIAFQ